MRVLSFDETGLIKLINPETKSVVSYGSQNRQEEIVGVCWLVQDEVFAILRRNGNLDIWRASLDSLLFCTSLNTEIVNPTGITVISSDQVICYGEEGVVAFFKIDENDIIEVQENLSFLVRGPSTKCLNRNNIIFFGGKENDIQQWDINTKQLSWSGKNVSNDKLSLRYPIWITSMDFLSPDINNTNEVITGTAYKQIRLYDIRVKRQPVTSINDVSEFRITNIQTSFYNNNMVYISDCSGYMQLYDIRTHKRIKGFSNSNGSIRDMKQDISHSRLCSVSLDRNLHLYDIHKNKNNKIFSIFLKNRLNACLLYDFSSAVSTSDDETYDSDLDIVEGGDYLSDEEVSDDDGKKTGKHDRDSEGDDDDDDELGDMNMEMEGEDWSSDGDKDHDDDSGSYSGGEEVGEEKIVEQPVTNKNKKNNKNKVDQKKISPPPQRVSINPQTQTKSGKNKKKKV